MVQTGYAWRHKPFRQETLPDNNPRNPDVLLIEWVVMDSNHRSRKTADLQSAPFGHSGNHPFVRFGASCRIRTNDPEITNHVLWPTELKRQNPCSRRASQTDCIRNGCKDTTIFQTAKTFGRFFHLPRSFSLNLVNCTFKESTHWSTLSSKVSQVFST